MSLFFKSNIIPNSHEKKILLLFLSCFSCTIAEAQTTPPLFQGSDDVQLFRQALMERVTEVYYSDGYTPDDLIHYFWMNLPWYAGTLHRSGNSRHLSPPNDYRERTDIGVASHGVGGIDSFQPATERGEKVPYRQTMEYNFAYIPEVTTPACFKRASRMIWLCLKNILQKELNIPKSFGHGVFPAG